MKKLTNVIRTITVALWPVLLLFISGYVQRFFDAQAGRTYQLTYRFALVPFYIISGAVFAFNVCANREFFKRVSALIVHIITLALVTLFYSLLLMYYLPVHMFFDVAIIRNIILFTPISTSSLVFGFTIFSSIRGIFLFAKRHTTKYGY